MQRMALRPASRAAQRECDIGVRTWARFWIGSGLKWVIDPTGSLKPWTDNQFNLGSDTGNAAKTVFAKTSFNSVVFGRNDFEIPNDSATGTVINQLAIFNTSNPSRAVLATTSSTNGVIGVGTRQTRHERERGSYLARLRILQL